MPRILVVEDDPPIAARVVRGLRDAGYEVELVTDGFTAQARVLAGGVDLVVLDLSLPGQDGDRVLQTCRARVRTPFVVVTARTGLDARLRSFDLGAVDYLPKPFFLEELVARIRARLDPGPAAARLVRFADVVVDPDTRDVSVGGEDAGLTAYEVNVLLHLVARPGRPVTREQLLTHALPPESEATERTVDSYVAHIRKKLGPAGAAHLQTVFRLGYRFRIEGA
jgi:DNA-binding response OmpR family regulator